MNNDTNPDWNSKSKLTARDQLTVSDEMRVRCPVAYSEALGWSIFRHADVTHILNDHESYSNAVSQHLSVPNGMDPPEHTAYRNLIERYFLPDRIDAFEPVCRKIASNLIDEAISRGGGVEVMRELAAPFAAQSQCAFLGWPTALHPRLIHWVSRNQQAIRDTNRPMMSELAREFEAIVDEQVDRRMENQAGCDDDITTSLMNEEIHGRKLSSEELSSILRNWTVGEIGTISASIGILLHHLAQSNELQERMRSDLSQLPVAIDEILRVHNPLAANRRVTTCPVQIGDRHIGANQRITLHWISANRDESVFPHADEIRIDRDPTKNLLYGAGIHVCPGAPLARLEQRVFLETLFRRTSRITPQPDSSPTPAIYPASGFSSLGLHLVPQPPISVSD